MAFVPCSTMSRLNLHFDEKYFNGNCTCMAFFSPEITYINLNYIYQIYSYCAKVSSKYYGYKPYSCNYWVKKFTATNVAYDSLSIMENLQLLKKLKPKLVDQFAGQ